MAERAEQLSIIYEADDVENVYLTFEVQGEEYAVNIGYVTEIVGLQKVSEVPDVPAFIKGVINLRGQVIPIMDMRLRFGLPWREYGDRTTVIVLELEDVPTGLVVDQVTDVISIGPEQIAPPPRWGSGEDGEGESVIQGLGRHDESVSVILDVPRLLSAHQVRLDVGHEMLAAAGSVVVETGEPED